jgi:hypothetical protein
MEVRLLTLIEKEAIEGKLYAPSSYFNPIQDCNDEWIISNEECENCVETDYLWVKDLPIIEYCKKPTPPLDEL